MKHVEKRQWIRDLKPHCTVPELAEFLRSKPCTVIKCISQLDLFNDGVIRRRYHRQKVQATAKQKALKRRAMLASILPMGFTDNELSKKVGYSAAYIAKVRPGLGRHKYITDDYQRQCLS